MKRDNSRGLRFFSRYLGLGVLFSLLVWNTSEKVFAQNEYRIKIGGANVGVSDSSSAAGTGSVIEFEEGTGATGSSDSLGTSYSTTEGSSSLSSSGSDYSMDLTGRIPEGVFAGPVELSGKNYIEAESAITGYVSGLQSSEISLSCSQGNTATVTAGDLGLAWSDRDLISEALNLGKSGNIVVRYKTLKDIEHDKRVFPLELSCSENSVRAIVEAEGEKYNVAPQSPRVKRENGAFTVLQEGKTGYEIDVEASVDRIMTEMQGFEGGNKTIELEVSVTEPRGTEEDFALMKDVLGTYHTSFSSSGADRSGNVRNGTKLINGTMLYPGDQFSVYNAVSPFTEENGYFLAGSYANGVVVESLGGGICQVSSTLYNAVLRAELQIDERHNHSMIVTYVDLSSDAAISGTQKDFKFTNNLDDPIYIEGYTTDSKEVYFTIYGVEKRPSNRTVEFESVEISRTEPEGVNIVADSSQPVGHISSQSAHTGYVGELWKIVKENGVETERVRINKSTYRMTPKTVSVGTAADDAAISEMVRAAIASGDLDTVKGTIANLQAAARGEVVLPTPEEQAAAAAQLAAAQAAQAQALAEAAAQAAAENALVPAE